MNASMLARLAYEAARTNAPNAQALASQAAEAYAASAS